MMKRTSLLVALLVVVGMLVLPATGALAQETGTETESEGNDVAPGERLSGVVGVQSVEFDGEIDRNAFRIALEHADDNATRAGHIAEKLNETERRLGELDERMAQLREQRENGEITEGQYRARAARMAVEVETVEKQLNRSNATAAELPAETLEANGVNATAIRTLRHHASEMTGQEVSEIARSIAGDRSGMVDRGPGTDRVGSDERSEAERGNGSEDRNAGGDSDNSNENVSDERRSDAETDGDEGTNGTT